MTSSLHRIAFISYLRCPLSFQEGKETGGLQLYVLELAKQLAAKGLIIDIFTRVEGTTEPLIVEVVPGLRVIHLLAGPQAPLPKTEISQYLPQFIRHFLEFTVYQIIILKRYVLKVCNKFSLLLIFICYEILHCLRWLGFLFLKESFE